MNKKELILYVVGGIVFFFFKILFNLIGFGLFHHPGLAMVLMRIYEMLFWDFITGNFFNFAPLIILFTFLQGGMLSLLIAYGYYKRKARRKEGTINPISKKSLFIAVAIFIGFVLLAGMIVWLGGF